MELGLTCQTHTTLKPLFYSIKHVPIYLYALSSMMMCFLGKITMGSMQLWSVDYDYDNISKLKICGCHRIEESELKRISEK